jgi:hypothetical protein
MKRNDAPHIAPKATSSTGVSQELCVAADAAALAEVGLGVDMERAILATGA